MKESKINLSESDLENVLDVLKLLNKWSKDCPSKSLMQADSGFDPCNGPGEITLLVSRKRTNDRTSTEEEGIDPDRAC